MKTNAIDCSLVTTTAAGMLLLRHLSLLSDKTVWFHGVKLHTGFTLLASPDLLCGGIAISHKVTGPCGAEFKLETGALLPLTMVSPSRVRVRWNSPPA